MTQKDALERALKELGGRAQLQDIYPVALKYITHKDGSKIHDSLRGCIHDKRRFRPSPNKPAGWYELPSYQEEIATLKKENEDLKENTKRLSAIPKEADFVDKFLEEVMSEYKRKRAEADPIRNILRHMGHEEAAAVLDAWIDEKEDELVKALENLRIHIHNITMTEQNTDINVNNQFKGNIHKMHVAHADVAVGVAEDGANVFHHQSNNGEGDKNHGRE